MSYIFAILLFSFLIFIHEFGHFAAAKFFGVQVNEFSVFMGPVLWQKKKGETLYSVRLIPIGGFCAMEGEEGGSDNPRSFDRAAWWKRGIILVAGAFMNFLAGLALFTAFFAPDKQFITTYVDSVEENCSFYGERGILPGDKIIAVDGERIYVYNDFTLLLSLEDTDRHELEIQRNGRKLVFRDLLMERRAFPNEDGTESLRYGFDFAVKKASFVETAKYVWNSAMDTARMVKLSIFMLIRGRAGIEDVSGPVGIVNEMAEIAATSGSPFYAFLNLLYMGGFIAINLAVMNLLPIPALDGGRIVGLVLVSLIELILKRKIDPKYEGYVHAAGMTFLLMLMAVVMYKDIIFAVKG